MSKPKNKIVSSEDSDSGPDDRNVPPSKKAKTAPAPKSKKGTKASYSGDNDEEPMFQLARMRYAKVREFNGRVMVDIREYYDAGGDLRPGKKGICLTVDQWTALKNHMEDIDNALKKF